MKYKIFLTGETVKTIMGVGTVISVNRRGRDITYTVRLENGDTREMYSQAILGSVE